MGGVDIPTSQAVPAPFPGEPPIEMMWSIRREAHPMADTMYDTDPKLAARQEWAGVARWAAIAIVIWAIVTHVIARVPVPPVIVIGAVFGAFIPFLNARRRKLGLVPGHESMTGTLTVGR